MSNQEIIALALVAMVVTFAVMRYLNKQNSSDCNSCSKNPEKTPDSSEEKVLKFYKK